MRIKFSRRKYVMRGIAGTLQADLIEIHPLNMQSDEECFSSTKRTWKDEWSAQKASTSSPAKRPNQSNDDEEGTVSGLPQSAHPVDIPPPPAHNALPTEYDRQILNQLRTISQTQMVLKRN